MKHEDAEEGDDHDGEDDVGEVKERLAPQHHVERDVRGHGLRCRAQVGVGPPGEPHGFVIVFVVMERQGLALDFAVDVGLA